MKQLFKSEITGKVYESEQECLDAEKEHNELVLKQNKEKEERKASADEIKKAYEDYLALRKKNKESEREAYSKYIDLRNKFVDKYGSYHVTVTQKSNLKPNIDLGFNEIDKLVNSFFDNFWMF